MPNEAIEVSDVVPATPERIYDAWLDSAEHSAMTGTEARVEGREVGASFQAGNGYVWGKCLELVPNRLLVMSLRSLEFPPGVPDSHLEVILEPVEGGTRLTIRHSEIPEGQSEAYRKGWVESYLGGMKRYFAPTQAAPVVATESPIVEVEVVAVPKPKPAPKKRLAAKKKPARAAKKKAAKRGAKKASARRPAKKASAKRKAVKAGGRKRVAKKASAKKRPAKRSRRRK
jgi:uncharacterized protein YndB with AHSA1/START domain